MHYFIQGLFFITGLLSLLAALFNWDWFFQARNSQAIVKNVGRQRARLFYGCLGALLMGTAIYFFLEIQKIS